MIKKRIFDSAVFWQVITFNSPEVVFLIRNRILFFPGALRQEFSRKCRITQILEILKEFVSNLPGFKIFEF